MKGFLCLFFALIFLSQGVLFSEEEKTYELGEVVVTATKTERVLADVPVRTEVITGEEIEAAGAKTLLEVLEKGILGVRTVVRCAGCNYSDLRMQGLGADYNQILIDGQPLLGAVMGVYGLEQILTENIERIEVIKGSSSSLYGANAIGGVINVITKEPCKGKPSLSLKFDCGSYETYNASSTISGRKGNIASILTIHKSESDAVDENEDNFTDRTERDNRNLSLKTHLYFLDDAHRLSLYGREFHEERNFGPMPALPAGIKTKHYEYGIGYRAVLGEDSIFNLNLATSEHERNLRNPVLHNDANEDIYIIDGSYSHALLGGRHTLTGGITYRNEELREVINYAASPERDSQTAGVYLQDEIKALENLDIILGVRRDNVDSFYIDEASTCARLGARWKAAERAVYRVSVGQGFKAPYLFAQKLHVCPLAPAIYRDPGLESEKSISCSIGGEFYYDACTFGLNLFRTNIEDMIMLTTAGSHAGYDWVLKNGSDAYTQGLEANVKTYISDSLSLKLGMAFTDAQFKEEQTVFGDKSEHIMRVPELSGLLGLEYTSDYGLKVNFGGRFTGSQFIENKVEQGIDETPDFTVWDIKADKKFQGGRYSAFLGVDNLFDYTQEKRYTVPQDSAYAYAPLTGRYVYGGMKINL